MQTGDRVMLINSIDVAPQRRHDIIRLATRTTGIIVDDSQPNSYEVEFKIVPGISIFVDVDRDNLNQAI